MKLVLTGQIFYGVCLSVSFLSKQGRVSEWSKEAVLKTVVPQGTVGSNPTSSARFVAFFFCKNKVTKK